MTLRFSPNLSLLWADLPLPERFARPADQAAAVGCQVMIEAFLISHIQIADVPGRGEPGTGEINYRFLLDYLGHRGYDGYVGLEYRPSGGSPEESFGWLDDFGLARGSGS